LDLAGELGCMIFVGRGDRARRQIHSAAESLVGGQAMLLFPEGANFTLPRWHAAIAQLRSTGGIRCEPRAAAIAHAATAQRRGCRRGGGSTARQRARACSQRLLCGWTSASLVAATHPPANAHPNRFCTGHPYSAAGSAGPLARPNVDPSRFLGGHSFRASWHCEFVPPLRSLGFLAAARGRRDRNAGGHSRRGGGN
jgi:hypothetical protein